MEISMNCPVCKREIMPGNKFCRYCGGKLDSIDIPTSEICTNCGNELRTGKAYCTKCGAYVLHNTPIETCWKCGNTLVEGRDFCGQCGTNANQIQPTELQKPRSGFATTIPNFISKQLNDTPDMSKSKVSFDVKNPVFLVSVILCGLGAAALIYALTLTGEKYTPAPAFATAPALAPTPVPAPMPAAETQAVNEGSQIDDKSGGYIGEDGQEENLSEPDMGRHDLLADISGIESFILELNKRYIGYEELAGYDQSQIAYIRNGIYALSGNIFKKKEYRDYFSTKSWYEPYSEDSSIIVKRFNDYQSRNLEIILELESNMGWR